MITAWNRLLEPLRRRVDNMVARALVRLVGDGSRLQELQLEVLKGEIRERCERFQEYGFTSNPLTGAEAVVLFVGGNRDHPLVVAVDDRRYRKTGLQPGEVAVYTDEGDYILLKRGRKIEVVAGVEVKATAPTVHVVAATKVRLETPLTEVTGNLTVAGTAQVAGQITGSGGLAVSGGSGAQVTGNFSATGNVSDGAGSMAGIRTTYNGHTHNETGAVTNAPNQPM